MGLEWEEGKDNDSRDERDFRAEGTLAPAINSVKLRAALAFLCVRLT